jgi:hypothetical protein
MTMVKLARLLRQAQSARRNQRQQLHGRWHKLRMAAVDEANRFHLAPVVRIGLKKQNIGPQPQTWRRRPALFRLAIPRRAMRETRI